MFSLSIMHFAVIRLDVCVFFQVSLVVWLWWQPLAAAAQAAGAVLH